MHLSTRSNADWWHPRHQTPPLQATARREGSWCTRWWQHGGRCYNFSFSYCNSCLHMPTCHAHACRPTMLLHSYLTHHLYDHMASYMLTSLTHTLASPQLRTLPCVLRPHPDILAWSLTHADSSLDLWLMPNRLVHSHVYSSHLDLAAHDLQLMPDCLKTLSNSSLISYLFLSTHIYLSHDPSLDLCWFISRLIPFIHQFWVISQLIKIHIYS